MAADGEIIKSFLVGLGFDVDQSSLALFNKSIQTAALRVTALYGAVNAFAGSMIYAFSKISEGFEEMGYQYHIIAPAINKAIVLRNEMLKAYTAAGINIRKVIVDSIKLNMSLAKTKFAMEAIYKSVGSKFFGLLQAQSDAFRKKLYENMPKIIGALTKLVAGVFKAFDMVTRLGLRLWSILGRVFDFFVMLDKATDGWSTIIMGVIAAWKLLNLSFLATPLGMLLAGFAALLALWDDFKTFQEGGQSLLNWKQLMPIVNDLTAVFNGLLDVIKAVFTVLGDLGAAFGKLLSGNFAGAFDSIKKALSDLVPLLETVLNGFVSIGNFLLNLPKNISGIDFSNLLNFGKNAQAQVANPSPLGTNTSSATTNVNAKMQTDIHVTGSPNADATARATAAQQGGVNRDFVRNLKGATR